MIDAKLAAIVAMIVLAFSTCAYAIGKASTAAHDAHRAICTLHAQDLQRARETREYLYKHPNGVPALGLSRAVLARSISGLEAQAKALGRGC